MAGYFLYSLDAEKFNQFVIDPTDKQMFAFADVVSERLDYFNEEEGKILAEWPVDPQELAPILRERLAQDDWYVDLSDYEKSIFESSVDDYLSEKKSGLGYRPESNMGIYWDVIEIIRSYHRVPNSQVNDKIISRFGTTPFRGMPDQSKRRSFMSWHPMHSLHLSEDVVKLRDEVLAAQEAVMGSDDEGAKRDYENELTPALDRLVAKGRILLVNVDT
ncbi:hypothetical protein [Blastopirellula marina]|nr:hypothetical protein [Blastopirellula marina]